MNGLAHKLIHKRLQEVVNDPKDVENGRIPRSLDCEIFDDLTGILMPGDLVTISGTVKCQKLEASGYSNFYLTYYSLKLANII